MLNIRMIIILLFCATNILFSKELKTHNQVKEAINLLEIWLEAQKDYYQLPSVTLAIVHDQEIIWSGGFGYSNPKTKRQTTINTIHSICSISKLFTGIAVMQLRDQGKLQLNDTLQKHLPWYDIENIYPNFGNATIKNILTHSSGLPRESNYPYWTGPDFSFPSSDGIKEKLSAQKTLYPADKYFQYSNLGLTLAGEIVSEISGLKFDNYISKSILQPLQMRDTRTYMPQNIYGKKLAIGHTAKNRNGTRSTVPLFDAQDISPAAGFSSTVDDLAKFASWQFRQLENKDNDILESNTLREMHRVHWLDDDWDPAWGLGFAIWRKNEKKFVGHGGSCPGYRSSFVLQPDSKISTIFMTNTSGVDAGSYTNNIFEIIAPAVASASDTNSIEKLLNPVFEKYIGAYLELPWWGELAIFPWEGELAALYLPTQNPMEDLMKLKHIEGNIFKRMRKDGKMGEEIIFDTDDEGIVTRLWRHSNYNPKIR